MAEYIERETLLQEIDRIGGHYLCEWETIGVIDLVARQPAADVATVVHAHWIELEPTIGLLCCSACDHKILKARCNYCPQCGAIMDGKDDTECQNVQLHTD